MVHFTDTKAQKVVSYTSAHVTETVWHRRIQDFLGGDQGRIHPNVYWVHSSEDPAAQVSFFNKHG